MIMADPVVNRSAERFIPVAKPTVGVRENEYVAKALDSGWLSQGSFVRMFEAGFSAAHGCEHGIAVNSGTSALHLSLIAAGIRRRDHVICPAMTMIAVPNMILQAGAIPVFVDSDPATGNIDLNKLDDAISERRPLVRAVVAVHLYGVPSEIRPIPGVAMIEDCCEAHFARFASGGRVGSRGDFGVFSFFGNKILACGEGGMIVCHDGDDANRLRKLRAHCFSDDEHFNHTELGFGYRMPECSAAIGMAQFEQREEFLSRRQQIAEHYADQLAEIPWIEFQGRTPGSSWWVFPILCRHPIKRDTVRTALAEAGIETRTWFRPAHMQAHLAEYADRQYPVAEDLWRRGLYLPLFVGMTDDDTDYVCDALRRI